MWRILRWIIIKSGNEEYMAEEMIAIVSFMPVFIVASIVAIIASVVY